MSEEDQRIEVITGQARQRRWSTEQKLRIVEESFEPEKTVSSVARRNGVAPNLLFCWRCVMINKGAVGAEDRTIPGPMIRVSGETEGPTSELRIANE